ncbi:hypothetical protein [Umezawaea sp. Da 62-37]|uniref:hypothetical protein n=1 Tax=Umezawaea sp. Da 62-37 TaxID=3075927 RepID=UPI0028F6FFF2|nr:hypothetical protein [Umezawaea sp. Da 62-37]WNV84669.1 hypothetical protein RM788_41970 [Umezawaea sp. Da 62-37]
MEDTVQRHDEDVVLRLIAVASRTSVVAFLVGVWSIIAPLVLDRAVISDNLVGFWPVVLIAGGVMLLSVVRAMAPLDAPWLSVIAAVLGVWSIVETLKRYSLVDGPIAISGIVVGSAVIAASATSAAVTYRARQLAVE